MVDTIKNLNLCFEIWHPEGQQMWSFNNIFITRRRNHLCINWILLVNLDDPSDISIRVRDGSTFGFRFRFRIVYSSLSYKKGQCRRIDQQLHPFRFNPLTWFCLMYFALWVKKLIRKITEMGRSSLWQTFCHFDNFWCIQWWQILYLTNLFFQLSEGTHLILP